MSKQFNVDKYKALVEDIATNIESTKSIHAHSVNDIVHLIEEFNASDKDLNDYEEFLGKLSKSSETISEVTVAIVTDTYLKRKLESIKGDTE